MATPHVAGAAALLLQWNAAQTPEEIKNRLVSSARSVNGDVFTRGAGGIDLVAAFGANILAAATHVSFGIVDAASGIVVREETFSLRNTGASADTLSLTIGPALPAGATLEIIPSSVTVQPGTSVSITLRMRIDTATVPAPPEPLAWSTNITIAGSAQTIHVPAYFFRGSVLSLSFDEEPWFVTLLSAAREYRHYSQTGLSLFALVKPGSWDVITQFMPPVAVVVREQQNLQRSLSLAVARGDAVHEAIIRAVDDAGLPLDVNPWYCSRSIYLAVSGLTIGTSGGDNYRLSGLSTRYHVGVAGGCPDQSDKHLFSSSWSGKGLAADVVLPTSTAPFRRLAQGATLPAGLPPAVLMMTMGFALKTDDGAHGFLAGTARVGELDRTWHFQTNLSPGSQMLPIQQTEVETFDTTAFATVLSGAYLHPRSDGKIEVGRSPFFQLLDPSNEPEAVLGPAVERWDLDMAPNALTASFYNSMWNGTITILGQASWMTHSISGIGYVTAEGPTFSLQRLGDAAVTYPFSKLLWPGIPTAPGPHEFRSESTYAIHGVPGTSRVLISFDTTKADRDPPTMSRFRIEQGGMRTPSPYLPAMQLTPRLRFRVSDTNAPTVKLEWRANGTTDWTQLPLTMVGVEYDTALSQEGSIDLRLTATDTAGNRFQEEWTPAFITIPAGPPTPPDSLTATRSGMASIAVTWPPASSPIGVASYRVERLPDNATFTTSGTSLQDSNGLVPGHAYLYRVSAIDTNDVTSTPTAYDLATLIELQDDPVIAGVTPVRGVHVADLRYAIDAIRVAAGLGSAWTSYDPPAGVVRASLVTELRDRLNEARSILQLPTVQFDDSIKPGAPIRGLDLLMLRDGVK